MQSGRKRQRQQQEDGYRHHQVVGDGHDPAVEPLFPDGAERGPAVGFQMLLGGDRFFGLLQHVGGLGMDEFDVV